MEALLNVTELVSKSGTVPVSSLAEKDYVFLYFSASWCGPCKAFTPKLGEFYYANREEKKFEIVFISGDRDEASFKTYYNSHPWLGLYDEKVYRKLMGDFKLQGIPSLLLVNAKTGEVVSKEGRMGVMTDPKAENFPWLPSLENTILSKEVLNKKGEMESVAEVAKKNDYVMLYFSASWCGPCKQFTPKLAEFYNKHKESKKFETIYVSLDRDEASFKTYYDSHPWLSTGFKASNQNAAGIAGVRGIPCLQIYDTKQNKVVCQEGVSAVSADPEAADFPYLPSAKSLFGGAKTIITKEAGVTTTPEDVIAKNDYTLLYFSASWCPPCKQFTPKLAEFYKKHKESKKFEVVYMSLDRDEPSFDGYYATQPWLAIKGPAVQAAAGLAKLEGVPTLLILDNKTGEVVCDEGVQAVMADAEAAEFPWA